MNGVYIFVLYDAFVGLRYMRYMQSHMIVKV